MKGLFITGTDTNVGKTYIACQIATALASQNINVIPRKPVETGCDLINGVLQAEDATLLLNASKSNSTIDEVCPYRFSPAISPQLAMQLAGHSVSLNELITASTNNLSEDDFLLVEGAGGFYSPICTGALNADLAAHLKLPIILVTEDRVGAVNQVLLAINAIEKHQLNILAVILNTTHEPNSNNLSDNAAEIKALVPHPVILIPYKQPISTDLLSQLHLSV